MAALALIWDLIARDVSASATFLRVAGSADKTAVATERASVGMGKAGAAAETNSKRMSGMAKALGAGILVDAGVHMAKMAGDFQQSTNVLVTAAGESTKNLAMVRQGILDIATSTGTSWKSVTDGMYQVEKAGFRVGAALQIEKAAAQGAREEGASLSTVTGAMTSVMASYHLPASKAVMVMNEMKTAAGESKTTMEQFSGSLSTVLPLASANKISFADIAGSLATMTQHGTTADQVTQELAFTMRGLSAPNQVAQKEMAQLGISSVDVAKKIGDGPGGRGLAGTLNYLSQTVLHKMGKAGLVLLNTFNQSKTAAADATRMYAGLDPTVQKLAKKYMDGSITIANWGKSLSDLTPHQATLARQWAVTEKNAHGFQAALRSGVSGSQTYSDAIKKMTGGANGLNTTLQLTGESMAGTKERIARIAESAKGAGKNVSGWASTQKLFNVQMDMFKQRMAEAGIKMGTVLLPVVTAVMKGLSGMFDFISKYGSILKPAALALGGLALTIWTITKATLAWEKITRAMILVQAILNGETKANPIGLLVVAIAAAAAALIYAYKHSAMFREGLKQIGQAAEWLWKNVLVPFGQFMGKVFVATWDFLKSAWQNVGYPVFHAIGTAAQAMWTAAKAVFHALVTAWNATWAFFKSAWDVGKAVFHAIGTAVSATVSAAVTVFHALQTAWKAVWGALKATWEAVKPIFIVIGKVIYAVIGAPFVLILTAMKLAWKVAWGVIQSVYNSVIKPVFGFIVGLIKAWWTAAKFVFGLYIAGWKLVWAGVQAVYHTVIKPVMAAVGAVVSWLWNSVIKPTLRLIKASWDTLWRAVQAVYHTVIKPAMTAVGAAISYVWNSILKPVFRSIGSAWGTLWSTVKSVFGSIWSGIKTAVTTGINFVRNLWHDFTGYISKSWSAMWSGLGHAFSNIWGNIKSAIKAGINGIIHVINFFIRGIDWILGKLPGNLKIPTIGTVNFASGGVVPSGAGGGGRAFTVGGVLPGYAPGVDSIRIPVHYFSGGEGILVPEATRALGGAKAIQAINARYSSRVSSPGHFSGGGTTPIPGGAAGQAAVNLLTGDTFGGITNPITAVWNGIKAGLRAIALGALNVAEYPVRAAIKALPSGVVHDMVSGGFNWVDKEARDFIGASADKQKAKLAAASFGGAAVGGAGVLAIWRNLRSVGMTAVQAAGVMGNMQSESGFNPYIIQGGGSSLNPADAGGGGYGLVQWTPGAKLIPYLHGKQPSISTEIAALAAQLSGVGPSAEGAAGARLRAATTPQGAALAFGLGYERYAGGVQGARSGQADAIYARYKSYDQGGWLKPSDVPIPINTSGKPEAVLTHEESRGLKAMVHGGHRGPLIHVDHVDTTVDLELIARDAEFRERAGHFG